MVVVTKEGFIDDRYFQQRDLQASNQCLDFRGQALVIQNEIEQQSHQIDDIIIGLIQGMDGLAVLIVQQLGQVRFQVGTVFAFIFTKATLYPLQAIQDTEQIIGTDLMHRRRISHRRTIHIRHTILHNGHGRLTGYARRAAGRTATRATLHAAHGHQQFLQ